MWRVPPVEDQTSTFLSAERKSWVCFSLHFTKNTVLFLGKVSVASCWPKGLNVIYDSCPRHASSSPYFRLQNGWKVFFFFSFKARLAWALRHQHTVHLCLIYQTVSPSLPLIFIHPLNRSVLEDAALAFSFAAPKKLWQNMSPVRESAETKLFSAEHREKHSSVASPLRAHTDEAGQIWPFLCRPSARPWLVIWPVRCWVSTWQQSRRRRKEWKWKRWAKLLIDVSRANFHRVQSSCCADCFCRWIDASKRWNTSL